MQLACRLLPGNMTLPPPFKPTMPPPPPAISRAAASVPLRPVLAWHQILRQCGYPTGVVVIDFETFFSADYCMGRSAKALSTIEYVTDKQFEILGCGFLRMPASTENPDYENEAIFQVGREMVDTQIGCLKKLYGDNLEQCTVVAQNAIFDLTILWKHFGIHPPFIVDILGLARHWHSRSNNDLAALAKRHGLPPKGETEDFESVTLRKRYRIPKSRGKLKYPEQVPLATEEQLAALAAYGRNDVILEWCLFTILLPLLSNPEIELSLMSHTLGLFLRPVLCVDFEKGDVLVSAMQQEIDTAVKKVMVFYGD